MSNGCEEFWSTLPEKILHSVRVPIVEALWWIGEPLSAIALVAWSASPIQDCKMLSYL